MPVEELASRVACRADFVRFVRQLARTLRSQPEAWENADLLRFLSGIADWVEDMAGTVGGEEGTLSWKEVAQMLLAARGYD